MYIAWTGRLEHVHCVDW